MIYKFYISLFNQKWYAKYRTNEYKVELIDMAIRERVMRNVLNDYVVGASNFTPVQGAVVTYAQVTKAHPETLKHINEMAYEGKPRSYKLGALTQEQLKANEKLVRQHLEGFEESFKTFGQAVLDVQNEKQTELNQLAVDVLTSLRGARQNYSRTAGMYEDETV